MRLLLAASTLSNGQYKRPTVRPDIVKCKLYGQNDNPQHPNVVSYSSV